MALLSLQNKIMARSQIVNTEIFPGIETLGKDQYVETNITENEKRKMFIATDDS